MVERSVENSLCFGLYRGDEQAGFARVTTDRATFAYLADVFVLEEHRGRGLGKWLMEVVLSHPELQEQALDARHGRRPRAHQDTASRGSQARRSSWKEGRNLRRLSGPGLPVRGPAPEEPGEGGEGWR